MYENGKPAKVTSVVISTQHSSKVNQAQVKEIVRPYLEKSIPKELLSGFKRRRILCKSDWSIYYRGARWRLRV